MQQHQALVACSVLIGSKQHNFCNYVRIASLSRRDVMETTRKSYFYAMECTTWTCGGEETLAASVHLCLLWMVSEKKFKFSGFSTRSVGSSKHWWLRPADSVGWRGREMVYLQVRGCAFPYRWNSTVINDAQLTVQRKSTARTGCCTLHFTRLNKFSSELFVVFGRSRSPFCLSSCLSRLCFG